MNSLYNGYMIVSMPNGYEDRCSFQAWNVEKAAIAGRGDVHRVLDFSMGVW